MIKLWGTFVSGLFAVLVMISVPTAQAKCVQLSIARKSSQSAVSTHPFKRAFFKLPAEIKTRVAAHCVRVDGAPVESETYFGNSKVVVFDPPQTKQAKVILSYCLESTDLFEECLVPKDSFLAALEGGSESQDSDAQKKSGISRKETQAGNFAGQTATLAGSLMESKAAAELFVWEEWLAQRN